MFVRAVKDFDQYILKSDRCADCGKEFIAPPAIIVRMHTYHLHCARNLVYGILFELTGKSDPQE